MTSVGKENQPGNEVEFEQGINFLKPEHERRAEAFCNLLASWLRENNYPQWSYYIMDPEEADKSSFWDELARDAKESGIMLIDPEDDDDNIGLSAAEVIEYIADEVDRARILKCHTTVFFTGLSDERQSQALRKSEMIASALGGFMVDPKVESAVTDEDLRFLEDAVDSYIDRVFGPQTEEDIVEIKRRGMTENRAYQTFVFYRKKS